MREKEIDLGSNKNNISPKIYQEEIEVVKKSEKPTKGQEKIFQMIIQKNTKYDEDIGNLEKEMMKDKENPIKNNGIMKTEWKDVDSEELLNAHMSFSVDPSLSKDPNIPDTCPPLDSELNFNSSVNDYSHLNESKVGKTQNNFSKGSNSKGKGNIGDNILLGNKNPCIIASFVSYKKNSHKSPKNIEISESFIDKNQSSKLNWTVPKTQAAFWNENKKILLERNNSTIKVKGKYKNTIITPKRIEVKDDEYSNYSQAPTPVPEYRNKSCTKNKGINNDGIEKKSIRKLKAPESFRLIGKGKSINKSAITVKEGQAYCSVKTIQHEYKKLQ